MKFSGQVGGMSPAEATFLTLLSCFELNPLVMCDMISCADGEPVPLVLSAHTRAMDPSYSSIRRGTAIGVPRPYYEEVLEGQRTKDLVRTLFGLVKNS